MTAVDLPMVKGWLVLPHVMQWWGKPDEQYDLIRGDLDHMAMEQFVVTTNERPFAYLQCYRLSDWNVGFGLQPTGTRGIDQFIGEPDMVGRGHGSAFVRAFVEGLLAAGTPRAVTDPDPKNHRAVRAYEKAGFRKDRLIDSPDGRSLLMVRDA